MRRLAVLVLVVAVVAGCGNPTLKPYGNVAATKQCLTAAGYRVRTHFRDIVASTATRGALRASRGYNVVTVLYGADASEAADLRQLYKRFMPKRRARHILDITNIDRNALLLWVITPPPAQLDGVVACLH